jgi:hypothetical protein
MDRGEANALATGLSNASSNMSANGTGPLKEMLDAFISRMQSLPRTDRFTDADANALIALARRIRASTDVR